MCVRASVRFHAWTCVRVCAYVRVCNLTHRSHTSALYQTVVHPFLHQSVCQSHVFVCPRKHVAQICHGTALLRYKVLTSLLLQLIIHTFSLLKLNIRSLHNIFNFSKIAVGLEKDNRIPCLLRPPPKRGTWRGGGRRSDPGGRGERKNNFRMS